MIKKSKDTLESQQFWDNVSNVSSRFYDMPEWKQKRLISSDVEVINFRIILEKTDELSKPCYVVEIPELGIMTQSDMELPFEKQKANALTMAFEAAMMVAEDDEKIGNDLLERSCPSILLEEK